MHKHLQRRYNRKSNPIPNLGLQPPLYPIERRPSPSPPSPKILKQQRSQPLPRSTTHQLPLELLPAVAIHLSPEDPAVEAVSLNRPRDYFAIFAARSRGASPPVTNRVCGAHGRGQRRTTMCQRHVKAAETPPVSRKSRFHERSTAGG